MKKYLFAIVPLILTACTPKAENNNEVTENYLLGEWLCNLTIDASKTTDLLTFNKDNTYVSEAVTTIGDAYVYGINNRGMWTLNKQNNSLVMVITKGSVERKHPKELQAIIKKNKKVKQIEEQIFATFQKMLNDHSPSEVNIIGKLVLPEDKRDMLLFHNKDANVKSTCVKVI